jgi:hypothetical protein
MKKEVETAFSGGGVKSYDWLSGVSVSWDGIRIPGATVNIGKVNFWLFLAGKNIEDD